MIVVVEQNWVGHHPTYFSYIVHAAAQHSRVLALCPDPERAKSMVAEVGELLNTIEFKRLDFELDEIPIRRKVPAFYNSHLFTKVRSQVDKQIYDEAIYVLFCCLYHGSFPYYKSLEKVFPYPWSALMINSEVCEKTPLFKKLKKFRSFNPVRAYSADNCKSIFFLEHEVKEMVSRTLCTSLIEFPDFADYTKASEEELFKIIPEFENINWPIIGVMGHISKTKSILELIRAAKQQKDRKWGVCVIGQFDRNSFSSEEYDEILSFLNSDILSLFHNGRVETEALYNAAINKLDIFFACYQNFYRSSNNLVKCAEFKKPVIVLNHGCMEQRVSKYKLGEVIETLEPNDILNAIEKLLNEEYQFGDTTTFLNINDVNKVSEIIGQEYKKACLIDC